jgi:hypothetical protein
MKHILNIIFIFISNQIFADIFICLESNDLICLKSEIKIDKSWKTALNNARESVVQVAIRTKNVDGLKYLLKHGALVSQADVIYAMKSFFLVDELYFKRGEIDVWDVWIPAIEEPASLTERILYAINKNPTKEQIIALTKVIDLFSSRDELSTYLVIANTVPEFHEIMISNYKNLFLQDEILNTESLKFIVRNLISTNVSLSLLQLIVDVYWMPPKQPFAIPAPPTNMPNDIKQVENVTAAIMERSRQLYEQIPPKALVQHVISPAPHQAVDAIINHNNRLGRFIELSIINPKRGRTRLKNYLFWHNIYNRLTERGDFIGAFTVGMGLNQSTVVKALKEKDLLPTKVTEPVGNFKAYRNAIKEHKDGMYLPSIIVALRDLNSIRELLSIGVRNSIQSILDYFKGFRAEYGATYDFATTRRLLCDENIKKALDNLPPVDAQPSLLWWRHTYDTIMFGQPLGL